MIEVKPFAAHYVKFENACAYNGVEFECDGSVDYIRVTLLSDGDIHVTPMCARHREAERKACIKDGFSPAEAFGIGAFSHDVLVNRETLEDMSDQAKSMGLAGPKEGKP